MTNQYQADWIALEADIEIVNALNSFLDESTTLNQDEYSQLAVDIINEHMLF
ncbi:hypothetical protein [uncultured Winogradskyella sp.]|uniref:hypothetical protein n=1 Tax=uncultured Winogradskyella sp. TaxID=395353 RepID=UPI00262D11CC|nr:hypothetical protein [uncultured Winogradskyella sp.]